MNNIKVEDNFLSEDEYKLLYDQFTIKSFPWYLNRCVSSDDMMCDEIDNYQLCHHFYYPSNNSWPRISERIAYLNPFFKRLNYISLARIKANLTTRRDKIIRHGFHFDYDNLGCTDLKASLFYVNTTNGYTEFEDGTKIEGIGNRLVTFPVSLKHTSTTCTDNPFRMVINFNYF
tara:strand:+ start:244 stop:765 length:522 start_codon:yes stop_codon:yes gene_type:complete